MKSKSCESCIHFWAESSGDNYNEPRIFEYGCDLEYEDEDIIEKYLNEYEEGKQTACPYYDAGKCDICGRIIGKAYVFWVSGPYSDFKCCSEKCQKTKNDEADWPF